MLELSFTCIYEFERDSVEPQQSVGTRLSRKRVLSTRVSAKNISVRAYFLPMILTSN